MENSKDPVSYLRLGWRVTKSQDPHYWLNAEATVGRQTDEDLFVVPAREMACHIAIIAQSGSGKSFFLGRLVEELILRTQANCLILDPNSDFRRVSEVENEELWNQSKYDLAKRNGKLVHEANRNEFKIPWQTIKIRIRSGLENPDAPSQTPVLQPLCLDWPSLPAQMLAQDLPPMNRGAIHQCHRTVQELNRLLVLHPTRPDNKPSFDLLPQAEYVFKSARHLTSDDLRADLRSRYVEPLANSTVLGFLAYLEKSFESFMELVSAIEPYISIEAERYYFGKAREYRSSGVLKPDVRQGLERPNLNHRLDVIDLPTLDSSVKTEAISAILNEAWENSRLAWENAMLMSPELDTRVPTFIIVDEAHNLIPATPNNRQEETVRDQFRRIVAEGRKFGLFLIFVSQRPDKLDPLIFSECESKAILKIGSRQVLEKTREMMGLEEISTRLIEKCLEFEAGRVLMIGRWAPAGPEIMYAAARRTVEGGRNLRPEHWARPAENPAASPNPSTTSTVHQDTSSPLPSEIDPLPGAST